MDLTSKPWYHGFIDRDVAEERLFASSPVDGKFLVRGRSTSVSDSISLSVIHRQNILHYKIDRKEDGKVCIEGGPVFQDAVKLIEFYQAEKGRLAVQLSTPCLRKQDEVLEIYENVSYGDLEEATKYVLHKHGIADWNAVKEFRNTFLNVISNTLHDKQLWFHNITCMNDAKERLDKQGCKDGMFIIKKSKSQPDCFTLVLCYNKKHHPYLIERNHIGQLYIKGGRLFDNLMGLVNYYSKNSDGLEGPLLMACNKTMSEFQVANDKRNKNMLLDASIQKELTKELLKHDLTKFKKVDRDIKMKDSKIDESPVENVKHHFSLSTGVEATDEPTNTEFCIPTENYLEAVDSSTATGYEKSANSNPWKTKSSDLRNYVIPSFGASKLDSSQLNCTKRLGGGHFGYVMEGTYKNENGEVKLVAVKVLKKDMPNVRAEFKKEADIMAKLKHAHIVELIGICDSDDIQIVMELTPFGQFKSYLQKNTTMPIEKILMLMWQVNEGMDYLESKQFVHRDLAARNVLLMSEEWAKISDFGLSRATGLGKNYYLCQKTKNDPWPIHWYAPESLEYKKFSSKGDVWSFGVTMWEALSYGRYPYNDIKAARDGHAFIKYLKDGHRLKQPVGCPDEIYQLMTNCWILNPVERTSFSEIRLILNTYLEVDCGNKYEELPSLVESMNGTYVSVNDAP